MTVKELFPLIITNYEEAVSAMIPLYNRDNIFNQLEKRKLECGICLHVSKVFGIWSATKICYVLQTPVWQPVAEIPKWTMTKEQLIEGCKKRISAMKKALELYPDEEI